MSSNIVIAGEPGVGKSTLMKELVCSMPDSVSGFYTAEVMRSGRRVGFTSFVSENQSLCLLAHADWTDTAPFRVGRYGVAVNEVDSKLVPIIQQALRSNVILLVDEIGRMQLYSAAFQDAVVEALDSEQLFIATMHSVPHPFTDSVILRDDCRVIELTRGNRLTIRRELYRAINEFVD